MDPVMNSAMYRTVTNRKRPPALCGMVSICMRVLTIAVHAFVLSSKKGKGDSSKNIILNPLGRRCGVLRLP